MTTDPDHLAALERIAAALDRMAPPSPAAPDFEAADAFVWSAARRQLQPVRQVNRVGFGLLRGIDRVRDQLLDNTLRFARGYPANNALLWGARGMGKSSLVKAVHAEVNARQGDAQGLESRSTDAEVFPSPRRGEGPQSGDEGLTTGKGDPLIRPVGHLLPASGAKGNTGVSRVDLRSEPRGEAGGARLKLIEIHREDIDSLPELMGLLREAPAAFVLFCDDLSFDSDDTSYKSLKAVLDGGIEGRPANVVLYATSNRRHLMPRDMMDNERATAINPGEAVEEKVSLSDRFGLWLGFHKCSQDEYLDMVRGYADAFGLDTPDASLVAEALEWSTTRGARSGRTAWQYIQDLAGRLERKID